MTLVLDSLLIVAGLALLVVASEVTTRSGSRMASALGVSPLLLGLTVTSIGTSIPELATNVAAGVSGRLGTDASGLALGNVLGSNMALITLLLAGMALRAPFDTPPTAWRRDGPVMLVALAAVGLMALDGMVGGWDAVLLLLGYLLYLGALARHAWTHPSRQDRGPPLRWVVDPLLLIGGLAGVVLGAHLIVSRGEQTAVHLEVPEVLIGLAVGVGTSLPEFAVTLRATSVDPELAIGNILGSAIANPLLALSAGALFYPVTVSEDVLTYDVVFTFVCSLIAVLLLASGRRMDRLEGTALLLLFGLYGWLRVMVL